MSLQATTNRIPKQVALNVFENWRSTVGFTFAPVLLVLLTMLFTGHFSRVPKEELEQAQTELAQYQQRNERLRKEGTFYYEQVQAYRKKFPKSGLG